MSDTTDRPLRRTLGAAAVLAMLASAVAAPAQAATIPPAAPAGSENGPARAAVLELVGAQPDTANLPDDFAVTAGYTPEIRGGLLVDPAGACSSPIRLPADFTVACQAHDLGYDLLRYAYDHGEPLGPWARQAVDGAFGHRLHGVCADRPDPVGRLGCELMATTADTAVDLNSRRQNYATPRPEFVFGQQLSGKTVGVQVLSLVALAFALGALAGGVTLAARSAARRLRDRPSPAGTRPSRPEAAR
jgi:hypothetical protein